MRVKMTYKLVDEQQQPQGDPLEDMLNWPDLSTLEEAEPHVKIYLDTQYGAGKYALVGIEEAS